MAIYRLEAKIISRTNGHSAVAAAAYRTGTKIKDERVGKTHDYSSRTKSVIQSVILRPDKSPEWAASTTSLWNQVERRERRKDSQLCREFVLAVPRELSTKEQWECAVGWAQGELVSKGMIVEVSLHHPKDGKNPHVHILCTMRLVEGDTFGNKIREWNEKMQLHDWRETWCDAENAALEKAGRPERVDHRSLKDRGIEQIPQPKIGKEAMGLKKRGVVEDPERFKLVRWVKSLNAVMPWAKAIEKHGEVEQVGMGQTWWERSLIFGVKAKEALRETVMDVWDKMINSKLPAHEIPPPEKDRGQDMDLTR